MTWAFRILAGFSALLLAVLFFYHASGEDAAGRGMREGFAVLYLIALAVVLLSYWLIKWQPVRIILLALLAVPLLVTVYGVLLWLQ